MQNCKHISNKCQWKKGRTVVTRTWTRRQKSPFWIRRRTLILRNRPGTARFRQELGPRELPSEGGPTVPPQGQEPRLGSDSSPDGAGLVGSRYGWRRMAWHGGHTPNICHTPAALIPSHRRLQPQPSPLLLRFLLPSHFLFSASRGPRSSRFSDPKDILFSLHISFGKPLLFASQKYYSACYIVQR